MADSKKYNGSAWEHSLRKLTTATEAVENPLYSDGTAITNYTISGNTVQNGTPTPSNPVEVNGVGVRSENLFNLTAWANSITSVRGNGTIAVNDGVVSITSNEQADAYTLPFLGTSTGVYKVSVLPNTNYTVTAIAQNIQCVCLENGSTASGYLHAWGTGSITFTTQSDTTFLTFRFGVFSSLPLGTTGTVKEIRINTGSTAKPYEPYGYKIPISSGGVTTNIYLGSTQTTRQIKKYVFDGTQSIYSCVRTTDSQNYCCAFRFSDIGMTDIKDYDVAMSGIDYPIFISDRFVNKDSSKRAYYNNVSAGEMGANNTGGGGNRYVIFCVSGLTTAEEYTDWFANNPTTLYYILETLTTGIVNEPLMKIGTYSDTLSNAAQIPTTEGANSITVDTTVQPSEFTATWTGWHNATVKEWDGSDWN